MLALLFYFAVSSKSIKFVVRKVNINITLKNYGKDTNLWRQA